MITWNPPREIVTIPVIDHPVVWYGVLFAFGFFVGFYIFTHLYTRYLLTRPLLEADGVKKGKSCELDAINSEIETEHYSTPDPLGRVAKKFLNGSALQRIRNRLVLEERYRDLLIPIRERAKIFTEKLTLYVLAGTLLGARLGEIIFYQDAMDYLRNPLEIFKTWEGGLASHGGVIGILIALALLHRKISRALSWIALIDLLSIPTAFAAVCIRMGNFINQEILGTPTNVPWAITFLDPLDGSSVVPRHPVQLYEALFYLLVFIALFSLSRVRLKWPDGFIGGLFFVAVFTFRFLIEGIKEAQGLFDVDGMVKMGAWLSIPCVAFGLYLICRALKSLGGVKNEVLS